MRHLEDGALRRLCDEPLALTQEERNHVTGCARCRDWYQTIAEDARAVTALIAGPETHADPAAALAEFRRRMAAPVVPRTEHGRSERGRVHQFPTPGANNVSTARVNGVSSDDPVIGRLFPTGKRISLPDAAWKNIRRGIMVVHTNYRQFPSPARGIAVLAAVLATLFATLALTPAGSLAQSLLTIFEPKQFTAVPVTIADLRSLPDLQQYGTMEMPKTPKTTTYSILANAAAAADQQVLRADALPSDISRTVQYAVVGKTSAAFTFSAEKVQGAARASGKSLPAMPRTLDGSTLRVAIGPVVITTYGNVADSGDLPQLVIVQAPMPRVTSSGATVAAIEQYLLAQPGVSPDLAASIRAIGDPTTTLPIPIPIDMAQADHVAVQGVSGLAIGDNTGIGSGVIWQKDGMVYGVAGTLPENQVLSIARSLH